MDGAKHHPRLLRQLAELAVDPTAPLSAERLGRLLASVDATYAQLDDMSDTLMTVLDTLDGTNCHIDQNGVLRGINDRGTAYFGVDSSTLVGSPLFERCRIEDEAGARLGAADLHRDRRIERGRVFRDDGSSFAAAIAISRIGPDRREQGAVVQILDVDDRVAEELALHDARIEALVARQAERNKASFLANMSHELRTPLNAIVGYSELLLEEAHGDEARLVDLRKVTEAGRHLTELIGGILDLAKIEAGRMELAPERCDVAALTVSVVETIRPQMERKGLALSMTARPASVSLRTDPTRVRQVLYNLLSNASKFTHAGSVKVTVSRAQGGVRIVVADTGIGIASDAMPRIFEEFAQADAGITQRFGGTGLGLYLSHRLASLLGGTLTATSRLGRGSRFVFTLSELTDPARS